MERVLENEILDTLPFEHPDALRNRREIRFLNGLMGNYRWLRRRIAEKGRPEDRYLELGAGSGDLRRYLMQCGFGEIALDGLDVCPRPADWTSERCWHQEDLKAFDGFDDYSVILGNLILHQFSDDELGEIGRRLEPHARLIVACELARRPLHLLQLRLLACFGLGHVTRHDGAASIRAGFVRDELPHRLGLNPLRWRWRCQMGWRGQYLMLAERLD